MRRRRRQRRGGRRRRRKNKTLLSVTKCKQCTVLEVLLSNPKVQELSRIGNNTSTRCDFTAEKGVLLKESVLSQLSCK